MTGQPIVVRLPLSRALCAQPPDWLLQYVGVAQLRARRRGACNCHAVLRASPPPFFFTALCLLCVGCFHCFEKMARTLMAAFAVLAVVLSLAHSAPVDEPGLDVSMAVTFARFAGIAYCSSSVIQAWSGDVCKNASATFQTTKVIDVLLTHSQAYVGYDDSTRSIVVAFRGTESANLVNWVYNLHFCQMDFDYPGCTDCKVHSGFFAAYNSTVSAGLIKEVTSLVAEKPGYTVYVTGHSLGGALASLCALDLLTVSGIPVSVYTYGEPRVGNAEFAAFYTSKIPAAVRMVHNKDIVPHLPLVAMGFDHQPTEYWIQADQATIKQCDRTNGEDKTCSDSVDLLATTVSDHLNYLNVTLSSYAC